MKAIENELQRFLKLQKLKYKCEILFSISKSEIEKDFWSHKVVELQREIFELGQRIDKLERSYCEKARNCSPN